MWFQYMEATQLGVSKIHLIVRLFYYTNPNFASAHQIEYCHENGEVAFEDGALIAADVIIHCTG